MNDFRFYLNPPWAMLGHCSAVLNGFGRDHCVRDYRTTLSIKSVTRGSAYYTTVQGRYLVKPDCFLILNDGQKYSLTIEARTRTETLCPFFERGLVDHVAHCLVTDSERQLDDTEGRSSSKEFCERLYPKQGAVARGLLRLQAGLRTGRASTPWLEDNLYALAAALVQLQGEVQRDIDTFPGMRRVTREELYRRLHRGRDFLRSCYTQPLTIAMVASAASLSPYHFQRMFKIAFHQTPMQYLQEQRLATARRLLIDTDRDVTSICLAVGFESLGSFSWLFRKRFGVSPRQFRNTRGGTNPQD